MSAIKRQVEDERPISVRISAESGRQLVRLCAREMERSGEQCSLAAMVERLVREEGGRHG